ncbi:hypothetical protein QJS04_geneDACA012506 [Acorus gramineus]|uniref:Uncharacterized protein n=1 Tax=Acorus gramineus TaxID=55184 RepID=A0AAV9B8Q9_ACOGR|nr:hypothetical protein QJS04_geneDACA012506 [Acorus gramineus]
MENRVPDSGSNTTAVQATNDDAAASKQYVQSETLIVSYFLHDFPQNVILRRCFMIRRSCVKKGYMKDDFVHLFVRRPVSRSPIINRGMYSLLQ